MNEANAAGANVTGRRNEFGSIELTVVTKSPSHSPKGYSSNVGIATGIL